MGVIILNGITVCYEYMEDGFMYYLLEVKCINCGLRRQQIKLLINKQNKAVIFDMDGVIFDSEQAVYNGWKELSQKYGFENLDIPYMKCIGVNAASSRRIFLDYYGEDFPYDKYKDELKAQTDTIKKLIAFSKKYAVATILVCQQLQGSDSFFDEDCIGCQAYRGG